MEPSVLSRSRMTGKKTVNSRRIMAAVMVIVMLAALTGCVGKEDTQTRKKNKVVEIPMILTVDSSTGNKNEEEVVERFNRAYKGKYHIDVDWVMETEEEYRKNLKRMNVTDELPAIITDLRMLPSFYQMMIKKGRIEDLTPYINEDQEWKDMIEPSVMESVREEDGKIYLGPRAEGTPYHYFPIGIQQHSNTVSLFKKARELGVDYVLAKEIQGSNMESILERMDTFLYRCRDAYITVCTDVFSSAFAPGVSAPQSLGLDPEVVLPLLKHVLRTRKVRGFDICEISPRFDQDNTTANLGAVIIFAVINTLCRMNGLEYAAE